MDSGIRRNDKLFMHEFQHALEHKYIAARRRSYIKKSITFYVLNFT